MCVCVCVCVCIDIDSMVCVFSQVPGASGLFQFSVPKSAADNTSELTRSLQLDQEVRLQPAVCVCVCVCDCCAGVGGGAAGVAGERTEETASGEEATRQPGNGGGEGK